RGSRRDSKGYVKEIHEVDLARIAKERQLREEEFRLIEVLAENGGEAFESLVRERFDLPKTTIWRMVKRLEKDGYISVEKVAGQNLLKVRPEYLKK
ncbi:MAG: winged helix-turn-helix transcriptional regulator, partial [Candidatus Methanosuratincola sp.]|nr:winged helix-turn-helix transcriptional regulator [Candidatus Methanosuratincola sp.]